MRWLPLIFIAALLLAQGCAPIQVTAKTGKRLPQARLSPDAVVLDIAFVNMLAADNGAYQEIWNAADEHSFSPELRSELAANGMRVGLFGQELPAKLRELLDSKESVLDQRSEDVEASDLVSGGGNRHLQLRAGRRTKILASKSFPTLAALVNEDGQVRGHQLSQAQCILALKPYPQGDGRVKLDVTPEIEHGEMKNGWARGEGTLMQRLGRDRLVLDRMRFAGLVSPGEWLVVSTTPTIKGLGEHFFAETVAGGVQRSLILVRLSQTQFDDLFAPVDSATPLATPVE